MLFSQEFNLTIQPDDDFYDREMNFDSEVFVDPFSLYDTNMKEFQGAHKEIINFFEHAYQLVAQSGGCKSSNYYKIAELMFRMDDAWEMGLGYGRKDVKGSSYAQGWAKVFLSGITRSLEMGINDVKHFESLSIFEEGIGCDTISDITCNILKRHFVKYTQKVCKKHNIPLSPCVLNKYQYNYRYDRWKNGTFELPIYNGKPFLLVPKNMLNILPSINVDNYYDYIYDTKNDELRVHFGYDIQKSVDKEKILNYAKANKEWISEYQLYVENVGYYSYDFEKDVKNLLVSSNPNLLKYVQSIIGEYNLIEQEQNSEKFIKKLCRDFKNFIENNGGYQFLYKGNIKAAESAAQALFLGYVQQICKEKKIEISKECNIGRGPVDFKFSNGSYRILLEMKLLNNSRYWNGYDKQLPAYLEAEDISEGVYMVIAYNDEDLKRYVVIQDKIRKAKEKAKYNIEVLLINARKKLSASKL